MLGLDVPDMTPSEGAKYPSMIKLESLVKSLSPVSVLLIDCGRASKQTRGITGAFWKRAALRLINKLKITLR
jgi:hypothetical protein